MSKNNSVLIKRLILAFFVVLLFGFGNLWAKDYTINSSTFYSNSQFYLDIHNASATELPLKQIAVKFHGEIKTLDIDHAVPAGATERYLLPVTPPTYGGSYNLSTWIIYINDGIPLSVVGNQMFNFVAASQAFAMLTIKAEQIKNYGKIVVEFQNPEYMEYATPILPIELQIKSVITNGNKLEYKIKNNAPTFNNNYNVYWVVEKNETVGTNMVRSGAFFSIPIRTGGGTPLPILEINFPSFEMVLVIVILSFLLLMVFLPEYRKDQNKKPLMYLLYYTFIFNLVVLLFLKYPDMINAVFNVLEYYFQIPNRFTGSDYSYFRDLILPFYYTVIMGYGVYSFAALSKANPEKREEMLSERKVWTMFNYLETNLRALQSGKKGAKGLPFDRKVKTSFLALLVKFYFLPMLGTWSINNIFHVSGLIRNFHWDYNFINGMLVDMFILVDTTIFAFSYAVESKKLNSVIRSVEPTILGWVVCLWCYPPFNSFSFVVFDQVLPYRPNFGQPEIVSMVALGAITVLWLIYVLASIALGLKASNLTNRGTVAAFPYSVVRHPAYASKNLLWILEFLFFGKFALGIVLAQLVIYYLRAITEERHLSLDPDYVEYKGKVRYRFIPGIW